MPCRTTNAPYRAPSAAPRPARDGLPGPSARARRSARSRCAGGGTRRDGRARRSSRGPAFSLPTRRLPHPSCASCRGPARRHSSSSPARACRSRAGGRKAGDGWRSSCEDAAGNPWSKAARASRASSTQLSRPVRARASASPNRCRWVHSRRSCAAARFSSPSTAARCTSPRRSGFQWSACTGLLRRRSGARGVSPTCTGSCVSRCRVVDPPCGITANPPCMTPSGWMLSRGPSRSCSTPAPGQSGRGAARSSAARTAPT
jgi:hypothetical protein